MSDIYEDLGHLMGELDFGESLLETMIQQMHLLLSTALLTMVIMCSHSLQKIIIGRWAINT